MNNQDYTKGQNNGLILGLSLGMTEAGKGGSSVLYLDHCPTEDDLDEIEKWPPWSKIAVYDPSIIELDQSEEDYPYLVHPITGLYTKAQGDKPLPPVWADPIEPIPMEQVAVITTSGLFTISVHDLAIGDVVDLILVSGGGGGTGIGAQGSVGGGGGGAGGNSLHVKNFLLEFSSYPVIIGTGGHGSGAFSGHAPVPSDGGATHGFGFSVVGGQGGRGDKSQNGGESTGNGGAGGSGTWGAGNNGQPGTFKDPYSGHLYGGGGGAGGAGYSNHPGGIGGGAGDFGRGGNGGTGHTSLTANNAGAGGGGGGYFIGGNASGGGRGSAGGVGGAGAILVYKQIQQ